MKTIWCEDMGRVGEGRKEGRLFSDDVRSLGESWDCRNVDSIQ